MGVNLLQLEKNTKGKDYIVGDLHGCYDELQRLLTHVNFDFDNGDRLFSVGDLIDRGPDSVKCIQLIGQDYFHGVRGNHEDMMILSLLPINKFCMSQWFANGGEWILDIDTDTISAYTLAEEVNKLPLVIVVGAEDPATRFNIVHSEIITKYTGTSMSTFISDDMLDYLQFDDNQTDSILWGRTLFSTVLRSEQALHRTGYIRGQEQLSLTYCGHTIVPHPTRVGSHLNIDTGGYLPHRVIRPDDPNRDKKQGIHNAGSLSLACHQQQVIYSYNRVSDKITSLSYNDKIVNRFNN